MIAENLKFSMRAAPDLQDWNLQSLAVVQAALGMMSSNFRRVTLGHDGEQWIITFVLEHEDVEDREEIEDFETEWDALQGGPEPREVRILVTSEPVLWPSSTERVLYQRREAIPLAD